MPFMSIEIYHSENACLVHTLYDQINMSYWSESIESVKTTSIKKESTVEHIYYKYTNNHFLSTRFEDPFYQIYGSSFIQALIFS